MSGRNIALALFLVLVALIVGLGLWGSCGAEDQGEETSTPVEETTAVSPEPVEETTEAAAPLPDTGGR